MHVGIYRSAEKEIRAVSAKRLALLIAFVLAFSPSAFAAEQLAQAAVQTTRTLLDKEKANQNTVTILA